MRKKNPQFVLAVRDPVTDLVTPTISDLATVQADLLSSSFILLPQHHFLVGFIYHH
jgi:hypothetical protein